jgi:hypothetical protein
MLHMGSEIYIYAGLHVIYQLFGLSLTGNGKCGQTVVEFHKMLFQDDVCTDIAKILGAFFNFCCECGQGGGPSRIIQI